jgi:hypothetical protein
MAINYSYPKDLVLENSDLFSGIRASDNRTVNFTAKTVSNFLNTNGEISISSQLSFRFTIVENQPKTISFPGGGGNNTLFSNITELVVSIIDASSSNVTVFLDYLVDSDILLSQQNEPNLFGHYKITGYTQNGISPFYTLSLEFIGGSGNITDDTYYDVAPLNLSQGGGVIPTLQQVANVGNTLEDTPILSYDNIASPSYLNRIDYDTISINDFVDGYFNVGIAINNSSLQFSKYVDGLGYRGINLIYADLTDNDYKTIIVPNASGTVALTSDISTPSLKEVLAVEGRMPFPVTAEYFFESTNKSETIIVDTTDSLDFYLNDDTFAIGDEIEIYNKLSADCRIGVVGIETTQIYYKDEIIDADMLNMVTLPLYSKSWLKCVAENVFELVIILNNPIVSTPTLQEVTDEGNTILDNDIIFNNTGNDFETTINEYGDGSINLRSVVNDTLTTIGAGSIYLGSIDGSDSAIITKDAILVDSVSYLFPVGASSPLATLLDIPTNTSDLVNDGENGTSPYVTADQLPSNLNLFATNVSSDIPTYFKLVTSISDPDFNVTPVNIPTGTITTTGQFIAALATTANVLVGNPGIINLLTIGNVRRTSGSGTAEFYYEVYHRDSGGTETLISTSSKTPPINTNVYTEFLAASLLNNGTFLATDRIVIKYYADRVGSGSNPNYDFQFGGTSPVRTNFPVPATNIPLDATPTSGSTNGVQSNGVFDALALKQDKFIQNTSISLLVAGWALVGIYYEYTYTDANITATSFINFTPNNASNLEVTSCKMLPQIDSATGSCKFYSMFPPQTDIVGNLTIFK